MTKVKVNPGPCGFDTTVTAESNDEGMVEVKIVSGCKSIMAMAMAIGTEVDPYEVCLVKPGNGPYVEWASENEFPVHACCPVFTAIGKCVEAEAGLALKQNVAIEFVD